MPVSRSCGGAERRVLHLLLGQLALSDKIRAKTAVMRHKMRIETTPEGVKLLNAMDGANGVFRLSVEGFG